MSDGARIEIRSGENGRFEIHFPFDRQLLDLVKGLPDRKWHPESKFWSIPGSSLTYAVAALDSYDVTLDSCSQAVFDRLSTLEVDSGVKGQPGDLTIWELNSAVKAAIEGRFTSRVWIVGEVVDFRGAEPGKPVFLELVDRRDDGAVRARVSAVIWSDNWSQIQTAIERTGIQFRLEDGLKVRVEVKVGLYQRDGLYRIDICNIDPNYTLGEVARRREFIVRQLAQEGLLDQNTSLPLPSLPLRIALITSMTARARMDFEQTLRRTRFGFTLTVLDVRTQGANAERTIVSALQWCREHRSELDVVAICRGGGSPTDLSWLDTLKLGQEIARFPLPIVVGIGHETDVTVLDSVARSFRTPTACAESLIAIVGHAVDKVNQYYVTLLRETQRILGNEKARWIECIKKLKFMIPQILSEHRNAIASMQRSIGGMARERIRSGEQAIKAITRALSGSAGMLIGVAKNFLYSSSGQLTRSSNSHIASEIEKILRLMKTMAREERRAIELEAERLDARQHRLQQLHPRRVLERGFALLRLEGGKVVTDSSMAPPGSAILAELRNGNLQLRSEGPTNDEFDEGGKHVK